MAFDFIKKVFSFGRKEEAPPEAPAAGPREAAPAATPAAATPPAETLEAPPAAPAPAQPPEAEGPATAGPVPDFLITERAEVAGEPEPLPPAAPADTLPVADEAPAPAEPPTGLAAEAPAVAPRPPVDEAPSARPDEAIEQSPGPVEPEPAAAPATAPVPDAEILPPLRQAEPFEADPLRAEIAPEPSPVPAPAPDTSSAPTAPEPSPDQAAAPTPVPQPEPEPVLPRPEPSPFSTQPPSTKPGPAGRVKVGKAVERETAPSPAPVAGAEARKPWFQRLREGLSRSSRELSDSITGVFAKRRLDEDTLQDLEDVLIRADLGVETAMRVTDSLSSGRFGRDISDAEVRAVMAAEVEKVLAPVAMPLELDLSHRPHVILVVGVNGTGKTTTIGKLAAKLTAGGLKVMLAAGDTFRAAAIEQLKIWGERTNSPVVATKLGADAAGLAYDAFEKACAAGSDVLIIDTAGRLQNKAELMAELEKIVRVLRKHDPEAPHTVLQTVDATTGQNALNQVEIFRNVAGVNGLVMTKLDGTARGGILVAIAAKHKLPVYFIGVGEQVDDLEPFSAGDFAKAIAGVS